MRKSPLRKPTLGDLLPEELKERTRRSSQMRRTMEALRQLALTWGAKLRLRVEIGGEEFTFIVTPHRKVKGDFFVPKGSPKRRWSLMEFQMLFKEADAVEFQWQGECR